MERHRVAGSGAATQDVVRYAPATSTGLLRTGDVAEPVARPRLKRREGQEKRMRMLSMLILEPFEPSAAQKSILLKSPRPCDCP
jgi:hypothetical protein